MNAADFQLVLVAQVVVLLALTRLCRRRLWFLVAVHAVFAGGYAWIFMTRTLPIINEIETEQRLAPLIPDFQTLPVPFYFPALEHPVALILAFLAGVYCCRRAFGWWKFAAGFLCAALALRLLFHGPRQFATLSSFAVVFELGLCLAAIRLPLQRAAFERLLGFPLSPSPAAPAAARGAWIESLLGHATLGLLVAIAGFSGVFGHFERRMMRVIEFGPPPVLQSPALRNAYDDLKGLYCKVGGPLSFIVFVPGTPETSRTEFTSERGHDSRRVILPSPISIGLLAATVPPGLADRALATFDPALTEARLADAADYFDALERARDADYCSFHEPDRLVLPNFLSLREMSRALAFRALWRSGQGRTGEALHDIETILRLSHLLNDDGRTLVTYMIGVAVRGIGLGAARSFQLRFRDDPAASAALETMLAAQAPQIHRSFDWEKIRRAEPGLSGMSPYFEIAMPGFVRATAVYYARWAHYDLLRLDLAIRRYQADTGALPARLDDLAPRWLARLPLEPFQGKSYEYRLGEGGYRLGCAAMDELKFLMTDFDWNQPIENPQLIKALDNLGSGGTKP